MNRNRARAPLAVLAAATLVALAGCTGSDPAPQDLLSRLADDPTSQDAVDPRVVPAEADPASTRWLGESDGVRFYAATGASGEEPAVCLLVVVPGASAGDDGGGSACSRVRDFEASGTTLDLMLLDMADVSAALVPDGGTPHEELPSITPNLYAEVSRDA